MYSWLRVSIQLYPRIKEPGEIIMIRLYLQRATVPDVVMSFRVNGEIFEKDSLFG